MSNLLAPDEPTPPSPPAAPPEPDVRQILATFAENLSSRPPSEVYGYEAESDQILQALASPLKGRVVIIGPKRVGKSAVALAVAQRITQGNCPPELIGREVWRLTPDSLPGLAGPGSWMMALDQLLSTWAKHPEVILFFDELTRATRLGASSNGGEQSIDVATWLGAALRRQRGLCLAEAEENAWRRFTDSYTDYGNLFLSVRLNEPERDKAYAILERVAAQLTTANAITLTPSALEQAFDLSQRYALDRAQPGKTVDLLHEALAVAQANSQLIAEDVTKRFAEQSGLPRMMLDDSVAFNEDHVLKFFRQRVLAQEQAVDAIVQSLSLLRARVSNPLRPMGVLLFLGPTGVGKTELARALAEYLYGHRERLVRFNMGDYADPFNAPAELFGNPYMDDVALRRGLVTNRLAGRAFSVIVLDEFEKANPVIYQRFLQLFDEGLLINGNDETVNLRNSIIIITSNFGAQMVEHGRMGFNPNETSEMREKRVIAETERYFTPEFMNRIDAVCIFHPLTRAVMADIARREIGDLLKRDGILRRKVEIDISDEVIDHVVSVGYSPSYGARYLKRQIEKTIAYPLAREINALAADQMGGAIRLYVKHGRVASNYFTPDSEPLTPTTIQRDSATGLTLADLRASLPVLAARVEALEEMYGLASAREQQASILAEMADVNFWGDASAARRKLDAYQQASGTVDMLSDVRRALDAFTAELNSTAPSLSAALTPYKTLLNELPRLEFTVWLSGPYDTYGAYLHLSVKSKHTSARQWVGDLARMYLGWAKMRRLSATVLGEDMSPDGRQQSLMLAISGFGVYGLLQGENGAHRLTQAVKYGGQESLQRVTVNISVYPELDDEELPATPTDLQTRSKDLRLTGLLLPKLTTQITVSSPSRGVGLTVAGNLPVDDLLTETTRLARIRWHFDALPDQKPTPPPGGLVRSYIRNTKDKGVHDHRTSQRNTKIKQVLEGDIQTFLDGYLHQRQNTSR